MTAIVFDWSMIDATREIAVRKTLPFELEIAKPCRESWQGMSGGVTERYCLSCKKNVHNLASMSTHGILKVLAESDGPLCARITRRADGSIVTADPPQRGGLASRVAGVLVGAALSAGAAAAQGPAEQSGTAIVSGTVHNPPGKGLTAAPEILFIEDGKLIQQVTANSDGSWKAEVGPGTYDVVIRTGPMFGERINAVTLHAGEQSFAPLNERFDFGRLGLEDYAEQTVLMGAVASIGKYPVSYLFKHPLRYMKNLHHNFG
jgi:hypothetical protein